MELSLIPDYWTAFVTNHSLIWKEIEFPWPGQDDLSAIIEIYDDAAVEQEATELWPGIGVRRDGFVPVGGCALGTGDPFFLNVNDGPNGPLYKIDHERVGTDGYDRQEAVETMLEHYEQLLDYVST